MQGHSNRTDAQTKPCATIKDIREAMLGSWDGERMHSRPMHGHQEEFAGVLFFFTRLDSGKAHEVMKHDQVNLAYADITSQTYISVAGQAEIVVDRQPIERY